MQPFVVMKHAKRSRNLAGLSADELTGVHGGCNPDFIGPQLPAGSTPRPQWGPGSGCGNGGGKGQGPGTGKVRRDYGAYPYY